MRIALVVITDRPQYIEGCVQRLRASVPELFAPKGNPHPVIRSKRILVNDCAEQPEYAERLAEIAPEFQRCHNIPRAGMAGAVTRGWEEAMVWGADFILHVEDDFRIQPIPLQTMAELLDCRYRLAQLVLKRQAWAPEEIAAGGQIPLMESLGSPCTESTMQLTSGLGRWVEHQHIFSLNPCLVPERVFSQGWPHGPLGTGNEAGETTKLLEQGYTFAFWGGKDDAPLAEHIGIQRSTGWTL